MNDMKPKGPKFVRYFWPVIRALKELSGSGTPSEVIEIVARTEKVSESEQEETLPSGGLRFANQVHFARQYLVWAGLISSSERGVWALTDSGNALSSLPHDKALELFKREHQAHQATRKKSELDTQADPDVPKYVSDILRYIRVDLTPSGFEHFCKRLLREYGFERVTVTGGPKDKGLDGDGLLKINPFMSFRVVFQCKRYEDAVTSSHVSTFRGSIPTNVDKGILITTSYFTTDAIRMAQDPGMKPIELIDGEQLVELMKKMNLGVRATYVVDEQFFDDFKNGKIG